MQNELVKRSYNSDLQYRVHYVCGKDTSSAYPSDLHYDTDLTIAWFKQGTGTIKIEGNTYLLTSGDMILLNYNELHRVELQSDFCERITLYLSETVYRTYHNALKELLQLFWNRKRGERNLIPSATVHANGLGLLLDEIYNCCTQQDPVLEFVALGKITELLRILNRTVSEQDKSVCHSHTQNPLIDQIIKYVGLHYTEDINCEVIAQTVHISKHYLARLFKDAVGISLWNYIINRRLLHFNDLIRQDYSVQEAAYQSGFRNYSNFYRLYKSRIGMSPQEFKKYAAE